MKSKLRGPLSTLNSTRCNKDSTSEQSKRNRSLSSRSWFPRISFNGKITKLRRTNAHSPQKPSWWANPSAQSTLATNTSPRARSKYPIKGTRQSIHPKAKSCQWKCQWPPRNTWSKLLWVPTKTRGLHSISRLLSRLKRPPRWTKAKAKLNLIQEAKVVSNLQVIVEAKCAVLVKISKIVKLLLISFQQTLVTLETHHRPRQINLLATNTLHLSINRWALSGGTTPTPRFFCLQVRQQVLTLLVCNKLNKLESNWGTVSSKSNHHRASWDRLKVSFQLTNPSLQGQVCLNQLLRRLSQWSRANKMVRLWHSVAAMP